MTRPVKCHGCPNVDMPRLNNASPPVPVDGLPAGWHGVTITGTPMTSFALCAKCTRRLTARVGLWRAA